MYSTCESPAPNPSAPLEGAQSFATTHWSVVVAAGQQESPAAAKALEQLCCAYWYPLYVYVRRQGRSPEDAQDLTQDFFSRLLEKNYLAKADPDRGKFRTFLLQSLKNFLVSEWRTASRVKRGGGVEFLAIDATIAEDRYAAEPANESNPDAAYEERWAVTLIERVLAALRQEYDDAHKTRLFDELKGFIWGDKSTASYAEIAGHMNLTEGTVKVTVHRLRQSFRERLRAEVADTVSRPEDVDSELRHLIRVAG
jgi:RNA polymerase sigma-70 factor (ECF subfamily)